MTQSDELKPCPKELWLKCLCAWNNVPCDNEAMKKYTEENWGKTSREGWKRVAQVLNTRHSPVTPEDVEKALEYIKGINTPNSGIFMDSIVIETIRKALKELI